MAGSPGGQFQLGQQVVTLMGGMGRTFDGGYAEYTCVPARQVVPFTSSLDWTTLGAVPEMLQTAHGSLTIGLDARPLQSILIRGGSSSVGMTAAVLAKGLGLTVLSTTRSVEKRQALTGIGVDHVLTDNGQIASQVREIMHDGVDCALELVGTPTLPDTLASTRLHGVVCFTGMLSNVWTVPEFYPIDYLPRGVRLTAYSGAPPICRRPYSRISSTPSRPARRSFLFIAPFASTRSCRLMPRWKRTPLRGKSSSGSEPDTDVSQNGLHIGP